jgi:energy-coupling factor transport system permease protein
LGDWVIELGEVEGSQRDETAHRPSPLAPRPLHPVTWVAWLSAVLIALTTTRNPLYLALIIGLIAVVLAAHRPQESYAASLPGPVMSPLRFGLIVITTSAVFNALMVHVGDHVLVTLPAWIPLIGGPTTLEALVYGALNGVVLAGLFAAFTVVNLVLPVRAALRLVPRAYYPVAVIMSIAVTFVPTTLQQVQQIREAQAVRGNRMRGVRSWLPLIVPLLEGSMERSMQLAETMMARGFASGEAQADSRPQWLLLAGLVGLVAGWLVRLAWRMELAGTLLLCAAAAALIGGLVLAGRQHPHTVYRPDEWHGRDWFVVAGALIAALAYLAPLPGLDRASLFYYPYPALAWPTFDPLIAVATLGLGVPAVMR